MPIQIHTNIDMFIPPCISTAKYMPEGVKQLRVSQTYRIPDKIPFELSSSKFMR